MASNSLLSVHPELSSGISEMNVLNITEAATVQMPMVRHAEEVGWVPVPPQEALVLRGGAAGLLFRGDLEAALRRFNPG